MKDKRSFSKGKRFALFLLGFLLCIYPLVSSFFQRQYQQDAVSTYEKKIQETADEERVLYREMAQKYNELLFQSQGLIIGSQGRELLRHENYEQILNVNGDGVMASIEIPKIDVFLPIYHGIGEEVLAKAAGHVEGSSVPVGGKNTRAIISAHRGLPNAKLFTRLDELEIEDYFFIRVLDQVLAYQVIKIDVISPTEVERIQMEPEKDLVSLLTCTPYGLNTHRLVVTGERVEYENAEYDEIREEMMSPRELFFLWMPFIFLLYGIITMLKERHKKKGELFEKDT